MKRALFVFLSLLTCNAMAGVYMGTGAAVPKDMQPMGCERSEDPACLATSSNADAYAPVVKVEIYEGSLKDNVERIVKLDGWKKVIWSLPYDYKWIGNTEITADSIEGVITQLLEPYPIQAVFYRTNQVVSILPREKFNV